MNEVIEKEIKVENMIYEVRGKQVMLDSDLAKLYQCKNGTKEINQAVKNNTDKFPERFSWVLNEKDLKDLRSKDLTSNNKYGGRRYAIRVFTEQGVAMLATILKSKVATRVSIDIMDAFVSMRNYISNGLINSTIEYKLLEHDKRINVLEETFNKFKEENNHIFFEGQIYDAYSPDRYLTVYEDGKTITVSKIMYTDGVEIMSTINGTKISVASADIAGETTIKVQLSSGKVVSATIK